MILQGTLTKFEVFVSKFFSLEWTLSLLDKNIKYALVNYFCFNKFMVHVSGK